MHISGLHCELQSRLILIAAEVTVMNIINPEVHEYNQGHIDPKGEEDMQFDT
jgi:hypothetical protein